MTQRTILTGKPWEEKARHAPGKVVSGSLLFTSGITARDRDGKVVAPGDMRAQAAQVVSNLKDVFDAAGTDFSRIVKMVIYVTDLAAYQPVSDAIVALYAGKPASTLVEIKGLASPDIVIEIECVAEMP